MKIDYNELFNKMLSFCEKYDGKDISVKEVRDVFNHWEIFTILYNNESLKTQESMFVAFFRRKIRKIDGILTDTEIDELIAKNPSLTEEMLQYNVNVYSFYSESKLLSILAKNHDYASSIAFLLSTDEAKQKAQINEKWLQNL